MGTRNGNRKQKNNASGLVKKFTSQSTKTGNIFRSGKQSKKKQGRKGRQEISTGYLPPTENTAVASDSYAAGDVNFAGSSADYDYTDAPLPTYAGASDTA